MSTAPTKRSLKDWTRWTTTSKQFPKSKYGFSTLLKHKGDFVTTNAMTEKEYHRIKDAAKFWARHHDCRVSIRKNNIGNGMCEVTIMLIEKHRLELPFHLQRGPEKYL